MDGFAMEFGLPDKEPWSIWNLFDRNRDIGAWSTRIRRQLNITARATPLAIEGLPEPDDDRPTGIELDIRNVHRRKLEALLKRARKKLGRILARLEAMGVDVTASELTRIKAGLKDRLTEILTALAAKLPRLALRKIRAESALNGFRLNNAMNDPPTARSAIEWLASTLATTIAEALVNAHLFKGEWGYTGGAQFSLIVGGAIALIGVAAGIGWAQFRRPSWTRRIGGAVLFAAATGLLLYFVLGIAQLRDAVLQEEAAAAAAAQIAAAGASLQPLRDPSLLPYVLLNLAGFALVCWKSVGMWGFLDLKRLQRASARATRQFDSAVESARTACAAAKGTALDLLDETRERAEKNSERGTALVAVCKEIREELKVDSAAVSDSKIACEQEYREAVEMVHPLRGKLIRFDQPPARLPKVELAPDPAETQIPTALTARSVKVGEAMPGLIGEVSAEADKTLADIADLAVRVEEETRRNRGRLDSVLRVAS